MPWPKGKKRKKPEAAPATPLAEVHPKTQAAWGAKAKERDEANPFIQRFMRRRQVFAEMAKK